ncbi:MAG: hypothetical protein CBE27_002000 [Pelagibacteraceae bacterium TMED267]|nr:MAG: hypothetical protein CBE27_002000 [Pelagibacteraceae bacterium TMED267]|tara:strand:+ start:1074 stop:1301 length:228 start_codon:yes stop_codon:yes gene_type:complete
MKKISFILPFLFLTNCSLNKDSNYWNEDRIRNEENQKKISKILKRTDDITRMTLEEYKIFIDDYTKKSKYPDINK